MKELFRMIYDSFLFLLSRYVKARTELTWDYGYEAGTVPEKEILCQCGVNKCRKKII